MQYSTVQYNLYLLSPGAQLDLKVEVWKEIEKSENKIQCIVCKRKTNLPRSQAEKPEGTNCTVLYCTACTVHYRSQVPEGDLAHGLGIANKVRSSSSSSWKRSRRTTNLAQTAMMGYGARLFSRPIPRPEANIKQTG